MGPPVIFIPYLNPSYPHLKKQRPQGTTGVVRGRGPTGLLLLLSLPNAGGRNEDGVGDGNMHGEVEELGR
jgi:hypothetical protein